MTPEERAAIDAWMAERSITSLAHLTDYINDARDAALDERDASDDHQILLSEESERILNALPPALAEAIEEQADRICEEARSGYLWLHSDTIAAALLDSRAVRRVFEGS